MTKTNVYRFGSRWEIYVRPIAILKCLHWKTQENSNSQTRPKVSACSCSATSQAEAKRKILACHSNISISITVHGLGTRTRGMNTMKKVRVLNSMGEHVLNMRLSKQ